ncbi:MAG: MlaD family protein [Candidatus Acidiferrales bacterium]|jgi:phospholipid/cholesterol/gamma-HCH transport system substrate-binding protein
MAQRKQLTWTELRVGVFVLVGLFIMAAAIFYVTGGGTFGPKYRLTAYLPEVEGLKVGAPVALSGFEIGTVETIRLNPKPVDPRHNIEVVMRIDKRYQDSIRSDSIASLVTQGLLGDRYVNVTRGITGQPLASGAVVQTSEEKAMQQIVERGVELEENLGALTDQVNSIVVDLKQGHGTLGKLLNDPELYNHVNATVGRMDSMIANVQAGQGTLGKLVASDELYTKVNTTMGHAQDILGAVREQKGTLGKIVYDPEVYQSAKDFLANGNSVIADVKAGKGTLGKLATDDTLFANLRDASANVRDASAKLNSSQGTTGKLFTDPKLYDNLTGVTGDMRDLISDFRQNPKKFLHVKISIF